MIRSIERHEKNGGATFSPCGRRRFELWRRWGKGPQALWLCLNPSTAGAEKEDASTRKIRGFTKRMGMSSYVLMNLFDWRATKPDELYRLSAADTPLYSDDNAQRILVVAKRTPVIMCAWGRHGALQGQGDKMLLRLRERGLGDRLYALKINADGSPAHPLMLPYTAEPFRIGRRLDAKG